MTKNHRRTVLALLVAFSALLAWWQSWAEDKPPRPLPDWVQQLVAKHFPGAELVRGHREGDEDEQRYELTLKRDGRELEADVTADVGLVQLDEELKADQLPEKVVKALRRTFPKADVKHAEKNTDIRVTYQVQVVTEGRKREVTISPRGKILEIEKRD